MELSDVDLIPSEYRVSRIIWMSLRTDEARTSYLQGLIRERHSERVGVEVQTVGPSTRNLSTQTSINPHYNTQTITTWRFSKIYSISNITIWDFHSDGESSFEEYVYTIRDYTNAINMADDKIVNVVIPYVSSNRSISWLSFSNKDINNDGIENVIQRFLLGEDMYPDSDYLKDFLINSSVLTSRFQIISEKMKGGIKNSDSVYYKCLDLRTYGNNCLIDCFNHITGRYMSPNTVRLTLGKDSNSMLSIADVRNLEDIYGKKVCILEDKRDVLYQLVNKRYKKIKDEPILTYGNIDNTPILYHDMHFSIVLDTKKFSRREYNKDIGPIDRDIYYFFDYETTYNPETLDIEPYAWCIIKCDKDGKILNKKFSTNPNSILDHIDFTQRSYLIGYNNSKFDNFILLKQCLVKNISTSNVFFANNSILSMMIKNSITRDLYKFLNTSLMKACEDFRCINKKIEGFPHEDFQCNRNNGNLQTFVQANRNRIEEYVTMDCVCLAELFFKVKAQFKKLLNVEIVSYNTLAGMSYDVFLHNKSIEKLSIAYERSDDDLIRKSIYGGRAQIFNRCENNKYNITTIDCTSLYPYVMMTSMFPEGEYDITEKYMKGKIGIYYCDILKQPTINIIPSREDTLNWTHEGMIEDVYLNTVDIETIRKYGGIVGIHNGIYWDNSRDDIFSEYFTSIKQEKIRQDTLRGTPQYNKVLRECCKLLLNSLSGKLAQRNYDIYMDLIRNNKDKIRFLSKIQKDTEVYYPIGSAFIAKGIKNDITTSIPSVYGSLIYSYARTYMYDKILSKVNPRDLYGMDTDSTFLTNFSLKKIIGNDFGEFKIENTKMSGIFVAPKCYCLYNNIHTKMVFKGVRVDKDKELHQDITDWDIKDIHNYYFSKDNAITIDTYRRMLRGSIMILCSNIEKRVTDREFTLSLRNRFVIKSISNDIVDNIYL